jgi:phage terminase large subunit-like protein
MTVTIEAHPHPGQLMVHNSTSRFKVLSAGRRWGKTRLGVNECIDVAAQGGRAWWVSPSYKTSEVGWRPLRKLSRNIPGAQISLVDRSVTFPKGGSVSVRSADNPDSLRGEGLDFVVMDECAFMKEEAWTEAIRPSLSDRQGRALFISTPKGKTWFWRIYQHGINGVIGWSSFTFPTASNPYIPTEEIEAARKDLPEMIFRQEYMAEFLDNNGEVFRRVMEAATAARQETSVDGHTYVMGVDWGKSNDFTAIAVVDSDTSELVHLDRSNQVDYSLQVTRLQALCDRFHPVGIVAEKNSMGEPLIEALQRSNLPVIPFNTTNASKANIIDGLALAFEQGELRILDDPILLGELMAYEMERLPSGLMRYNAPSGMHDDTVMALAFAWSAVKEYSQPLLAFAV